MIFEYRNYETNLLRNTEHYPWEGLQPYQGGFPFLGTLFVNHSTCPSGIGIEF